MAATTAPVPSDVPSLDVLVLPRPESRACQGTNAPELFFVEDPDGMIESLAGVDSVAPLPTNPRLQCFHCNTLLEFNTGASYVQCFLCWSMNAVLSDSQRGGRTLSMLCTVCGTANLAPWGTELVRCGQCNTVSDVSHVYTTTAAGRNNGQR
mmetsp:Transcript_106658/g.318830  ORF Transcript_106658/g.318830 Transcript_106658/m.318830 type:complete len:152 (+) Transcript_106658:107-562(+)